MRVTWKGLFRALIILSAAAGGSWALWREFGPVTVETVLAVRGPAVRAVYATGTVEPTVMLPIAPRNAGRLMELNVAEGDPVRAGQTLARLEDADLKKSVDELEARARFAKSQLDRAQTLLDRGWARCWSGIGRDLNSRRQTRQPPAPAPCKAS